MVLENKKQLLIIIVAVAAGIVATVLTSNYVQKRISSETSSLAEQYGSQQKEVFAQIQQRSEQQMGALAQELNNVKNQQAESLQKQMEVFQQQARTQEQAAAIAAAQAAQGQIRVRKPSLAIKTPSGKRAVTIMIDSLSAVGGLLNAGDNVDVIAHLNVPNNDSANGNNSVTAMIFQSLQVLAINTNLDDPGAYDDQQAAPSLKITVAVEPQEAGLLAFANKNGKLELALRSTNEKDKQMVKTSTWRTLADYVLENQGASIGVSQEDESSIIHEDNQPNIQIFRGGKEL